MMTKKCRRCEGWGEVAYFGELVTCPDCPVSAIIDKLEAARIPAAPDDVERLRAALQTCVDAIALYLLPSAMDGGIGECAAVVNAEHARKDAIAALSAIPIPAPTGDVDHSK